MKLLFSLLLLFICGQTYSQDSNRIHRIAKIKVDAKQLEVYKSLLKEQMNTAIKDMVLSIELIDTDVVCLAKKDNF